MLKLSVCTLDLTGDFTPNQHFTPMFHGANITEQDGSKRTANVSMPTDMLARVRSIPGLTDVVVETMRTDFQSCDTVVQVFLPGEPVTPSKVGAPDENGDMPYLRFVDGKIHVGHAFHRFELSETNGMVTIDGGDSDNYAYHSAEMLDLMIEGLTILRDVRRADTAKTA